MTIMFMYYLIICISILPQFQAYSYWRRPAAPWFSSQNSGEEDRPNEITAPKQRRQTQGGFQLMPPPGFQSNREINRQTLNSNSRGFSWGDPGRNDDFYVFDAVTEQSSTTSTSTVAIPGMETTQSPCEELCKTTFQYNPVCGTNGRTFYNPARLRCAQKCGQKISLNHIGAC